MFISNADLIGVASELEWCSTIIKFQNAAAVKAKMGGNKRLMILRVACSGLGESHARETQMRQTSNIVIIKNQKFLVSCL